MDEFWESSFKEKQTMWGLDPAESAVKAFDLFEANGIKKIMVPGFGYGRNARVFFEKGMEVTGIEISETAIALSKEHFGESLRVHHGSVCDMPFDQEMYDGVFCYALIHLLDADERRKFIQDCYSQLLPGGYMVFTAISTNAFTYGQGKQLSKNRFETAHGVNLYFYDSESIAEEFGNYGLIEYSEIKEPGPNRQSTTPLLLWYIVCRKTD